MTKVIKKPEDFSKSKLMSSIKKAGATPSIAAKVATEVAKKILKRTQVKSIEIKKLVIKVLSKINKTIAKKYRTYKKRS